MKPGDQIVYIDSNYAERVLTYIEPGFLVDWHKDLPRSESGRFRLENGMIVQLPMAAFKWCEDMGFVRILKGRENALEGHDVLHEREMPKES